MKSTVELLDAVKIRHDLPSDYALAKYLGCVPSTVYGYRAGKSYLDEDQAIKVADALAIDRGLVLAWIAAERARTEPARMAWTETAARLGGAALVVLAAVLVTEPLFDSSPLIYAMIDAADCSALCIMSNPHVAIVAAVLFILFNVLPFIPHKKN